MFGHFLRRQPCGEDGTHAQISPEAERLRDGSRSKRSDERFSQPYVPIEGLMALALVCKRHRDWNWSLSRQFHRALGGREKSEAWIVQQSSLVVCECTHN